MKLLILSVIAAIAVAGSIYHMTHKNGVPQHIQDAYAHWKFENGRLSATESDEAYRLGVFAENYVNIQKHNAAGKSWQMGLGPFADLTEAEFVAQRLSNVMPTEQDLSKLETVETLGGAPSSLDLRDSGAVNPIRDQGHCGSCWSFSTIAAIEGNRVTQKRYPLVKLSEQQLVDCSQINHGCHGGLPSNAMIEMMRNRTGLMNRDSYPYTATDRTNGNTCKYDADKVIAHIQGGARINSPRMDDAMMSGMYAMGTLSVAIMATPLQHYRGGIFTDDCSGMPNHAVNIVGYGTDAAGHPYWIMRNSWSEKFGERGYFRFPRNENKCNVNMLVVVAQI